MALHDPAEVAGARASQDEGGGAARRGAHVRTVSIATTRRRWSPRQRVEQGATRPPTAVELVEAAAPPSVRRSPAGGRRRSSGAGDKAVSLKPRENAAEEAGVEVEVAAQLGDVGGVALSELEEHPRLGQRVGRARSPSPRTPMRAV